MRLTKRQLKRIIRESILLTEASIRLHTETSKLLKHIGVRTRRLSPDQKQAMNNLVLGILDNKLKPSRQDIGAIFTYLDGEGLWPPGDAGYNATSKLYGWFPGRHNDYQLVIRMKEEDREWKARQKEMMKNARADQRAYARDQRRRAQGAPGWRD